MNEPTLVSLLRTHNIVGVVGNKNAAKTSLALEQLLEIRQAFPTVDLAVLGVNEELEPFLESQDITILRSKMDILDLRLTDTVIFIDEFALLFDTQTRSKQLRKLKRFCDRIVHNNCKLVMATTQEGFFNKFMCALMTAALVKEIEYASLVQGTWLQERVKSISSISDYRLVCATEDYYVVAPDLTTKRYSFPYVTELDTKKNNKDLFGKMPTKVTEKVNEKVKQKETPRVMTLRKA